MAELSGDAQRRYRKALRKIQSDAQSYVSKRISSETQGLAVEEARDKSIEILRDCNSVFGDRAQALSSELFDEVCQAEGINASSQMFDDVIDDDLLQDKVRYYARYLVADPPDQLSFRRSVSQLGGYYARRSAYSNTMLNCERNQVAYARVPGGGETCTFCMMLAGRGFVYESEKTAAGHQYHQHCDCVAMPGKKGRTSIYGYSPESCRTLADKFSEIDSSDELSSKQKRALKAAWSASVIGEDTAGLKSNPKELSEVYNSALSEVSKRFRKVKTAANYDNTINNFLCLMGEPYGLSMSGGLRKSKGGSSVIGACPNGEELWACFKYCKAGDSVIWIPECNAYKTPDMSVNGKSVEIKTPQSLGKIRKLTKDASEKRYDLDGYGDGTKTMAMSLLQLGDDHIDYVREAVGGFVTDESIDGYVLIDV